MDSYLERLRQELEDAIGGASPSALAQAPVGKWNAAQILEHLFLTYKSTNRGLAKCLERGTPLATRGTLKDPAAMRSFLIGITIREIRSELRRRRVRKWLMLTSTGELGDYFARCSKPSRLSFRRWARSWTIASGGSAPGRK